jgi:hypothetical protein
LQYEWKIAGSGESLKEVTVIVSDVTLSIAGLVVVVVFVWNLTILPASYHISKLPVCPGM